MRMHLEGVKNPQITQMNYRNCVICGWPPDLLPAAPAAIVVPIAVAMTSSPSDVVPIAVAVAAIASEYVSETAISIRSTAIPTTITSVVTVNKFGTLLTKV